METRFGQRQRWRIVFFLGLFGCLAVSPLVCAEIVTVFSDQGVPGNPQGFNGSIDTFPYPTPAGVKFTTAPLAGVPEGISAFQTFNNTNSWAGWAIVYQTPKDLSRFSNGGEFRFWVNSTTGNVKIELQDSGGNDVMYTTLTDLNWNWSTMHDRWVLMRIGMAPVKLSNIKYPGVFTALSGPSTFFIDNVHFISSTVAPNFDITIKNRKDDSQTTQVTWNGLVLPAGWILADQYVSLEVDPTTTTWGVQMYTDNTNPNANPRYTGLISSNTPTPAGLVDTSDTASALAIAWAMRSDISTITVVAADPNSGSLNSWQWLIAEDSAQVVVPSLNANAFENADPYITVRNNVGIHFSQKSTDFGPADPPYRIYLEGDFNSAAVKRTYQTSELIIELFYL